MIDLVSDAQRSTDEQPLIRIDDEHRDLVHALVLIIVGLIDHGVAGPWGEIVGRLETDNN